VRVEKLLPLLSDVSVEVFLGQLFQRAVGAQLVDGLVHGGQQFRLAFAQGNAGFLAEKASPAAEVSLAFLAYSSAARRSIRMASMRPMRRSWNLVGSSS
jgi:Na+/H+ antiporter NhaB